MGFSCSAAEGEEIIIYDNPRRIPPKLGLQVLKSWVMFVTLNYLSPYEQLRMQQINLWFYKHGSSRVQTKIILMQRYLFTHFYARKLYPYVISVTNSGVVTKLSCDDSSITQEDWFALQIKPDLVF